MGGRSPFIYTRLSPCLAVPLQTLTPPLVPAPARYSTSMSSDLKDSLKHGRYVNVAPHLRLVAEERNCWKHLESAAELE